MPWQRTGSKAKCAASRRTAILLPPMPALPERSLTVARRKASAEASRTINVGQGPLCYRLQRSSRRTIGLTIDRHGLRVRAPQRASLEEIEAAILDHGQWITKKLEESRTNPPTEPLRIVDGTRLPLALACRCLGEASPFAAPAATTAGYGTGIPPGRRSRCARAHPRRFRACSNRLYAPRRVSDSPSGWLCTPPCSASQHRACHCRRRARAGVVAACAAAFASTGG